MTKSDLILRLAERNPHLFQRDVERIVATILDEITAALSRGDRVELRGFGAFSVKHRGARIGRNPRTGESVSVAEKVVPYFKTGKELRERLNKRIARLHVEMAGGFIQKQQMRRSNEEFSQQNPAFFTAGNHRYFFERSIS